MTQLLPNVLAELNGFAGLIAERVFGYAGTLGESAASEKSLDRGNAVALSSSLLVCLLVPWSLCAVFYFSESPVGAKLCCIVLLLLKGHLRHMCCPMHVKGAGNIAAYFGHSKLLTDIGSKAEVQYPALHLDSAAAALLQHLQHLQCLSHLLPAAGLYRYYPQDRRNTKELSVALQGASHRFALDTPTAGFSNLHARRNE